MTDELRRRSIRIVMDLQACQTTASGTRGIGRYSSALFSAIDSNRAERELFGLISNQPTQVPSRLNVNEDHILRFAPPMRWQSPRDFSGGEEDTLDGLSLSSFLAPLKADVIHVSSVFEGLGERVALPSHERKSPGQIISATLYDLIPLLFQDHYFADETFRRFYHSRLKWLRQADLLLAISESSRQDAIALLGIEPWRIVTVHGGILPQFKPAQGNRNLQKELLERYGIGERFVLYTGGDDHRKNIRGAIEGYAKVPSALRERCCLVIVCSMDRPRKDMYLELAAKEGLRPSEVIITGFVPEEDLVALYNSCSLFVFPSLYEGLGLPVIEAMACGAPVIGGNNSSIREIISHPDALFDANSPQSIAESISKVLGSEALSAALREYGIARAKDFTWERSGVMAVEAMDEALARIRACGEKCAVRGWLPRRRMAMFTPLPSCRSGIADYNAKFLPFLARHFIIDLYVDGYTVTDETITSAFRIFQVRDFDAVAHSYDVILYEFGNSEFHTHMVPLLEKYPGVVGLHDAYLSGVYGYMDFQMGQTGRFVNEMLYSHGPLARRIFAPVQGHPMPNTEAMINLPCTKRVLDQAIGVISHSPFNLNMAHTYYPEGFQASCRIIPQMFPLPRPWSDAERSSARKEVDFHDEDILITTFGHIVWTKWGDRLLEAFLSSPLRDNPRAHLVYAGELSEEEFGEKLKETIRKSGLGKRIRITGFLSESDYERYLHISDVGVQLRTKSRGGTPRGVLDCLAFGVPVIVNNDASYTDYPDNIVVKLSAEPSVEEIAGKLEALVTQSHERARLAADGVAYIRALHDPAHCAAQYAAAIHEFIERDAVLQPKSIVSAFAPHLAACADPPAAVQATLDWMRNVPAYPFRRRRLLIDVSHIAENDHQTGIQRVVKQIVQQLYCIHRTNIEPLAVELLHGIPRIANEWLEKQGLIPPHAEKSQFPDGSVEFRSGDVLLMLDSSWERYREFFPIINHARASHVSVYTVVYDLLPLTLPAGNFVPGGPEWFARWLRDAIAASDGLVCISRATAQEVIAFLDKEQITDKRPGIGYWHLGSDFTCNESNAVKAHPSLSALKSKPYLLMVGTLEPRKSHAVALDAMETLWAEGHELCLCIAGKEGWMVEGLIERLRHHPALNDKLLFIEQAGDCDIASLYANASGMLLLSKGEGFGLPLVEAANHNTPILCSDIAIFHEVAGDYATYVDNENPDVLANQLKVWWKKKQNAELPETRDMPRLTWEQSAQELLGVVFDNHWLTK